jgi:hypothetical protein
VRGRQYFRDAWYVKGSVKPFDDLYDFNMDKSRPFRSAATLVGRAYNGAGTPFFINFKDNMSLQVKVPVE